MGLDAVEIVMAIEEAFDIQIEDSEAEQLLTPRDVIDLVALKTSGSHATDCLTQRAFNRLRSGFIQHGGQIRAKIKPKAKIGELISRDRRRQIIRQILDEIGVATDPHFVRPGWLISLICIGSLAMGISVVFLFRSWDMPIDNPIVIVPFIAVLSAWLALRLTTGMRCELDSSVATVGGLSRWLVARGPDFITIEPDKWTHEHIAARVREIVIEQLGCEKTYRENAQLIQDLGLG
jgi:acyl carrier protein